MISISHYDQSGKITSVVKSDAQTMQYCIEHATSPFVMGEYYGDDVYVANGVVQARPANPAVLNGLELTGLPTPCTIHINNVAYPCSETSVELEFDQPMTYRVRVEAWPYMDKEFTLENPPL